MDVLNREQLDKVDGILSQDNTYIFQLDGRTLRCKFGSYRLHVADGPDELLIDLFNAIGICKPATYISRHFYSIEDRDVAKEGDDEKLDCFPESIRDLGNYPQNVRLMMEWMYDAYDKYIVSLKKRSTASSALKSSSAKSTLLLPIMGNTTIPNISIPKLSV